MTEQEAIKEFEERLAIADYRDNIPKYYEAMELAVKDMKEIQQYREIGTAEKIKEELNHLRNDNECQGLYFTLEERQDLARQHRELEEYRAIGTVEELQKAEKEEDILKFYYCDSEDSYLVGLRIDNFYYAHYIDGRWVFDMSRHLPWREHVVDDTSAWKEHTYPSEPKEINFSEWLNGFIKKECGGTSEECRAAVETIKSMMERNLTTEIVTEYMKFEDECVKQGFSFNSLLEAREKQTAKKPEAIDYKKYVGFVKNAKFLRGAYWCPNCSHVVRSGAYCDDCGQKLDWSDEE